MNYEQELISGEAHKLLLWIKTSIITLATNESSCIVKKSSYNINFSNWKCKNTYSEHTYCGTSYIPSPQCITRLNLYSINRSSYSSSECSSCSRWGKCNGVWSDVNIHIMNYYVFKNCRTRGVWLLMIYIWFIIIM